MPGIFSDYLAPIARHAAYGVRELAMARSGICRARPHVLDLVLNFRRGDREDP